MTKNKKTIVFFSGVYLPHTGGVERYTFELATRLSDTYNIYIVTSNTENLPSFSDENGVKVLRLPTRRFLRNRLPSLKKNPEYKKLLDQILMLNIDRIIINTRFYETTFLGLKIAELKGIRPWLIDHSGGYVLQPYEKFLFRKIKKFSPKFYSVSKTNQVYLKREFNVESRGIFSNAIEEAKDFKKPKNAKLKILFAGRLMKEKGILDILNAYEKLDTKNLEFIVAGDGPLLEKLKTKYPGVKFLGRVAHETTLELFHDADIFVFPTHYHEGFPTVLLEAGANKCAVLTYDDNGGAKEIVGSENNAAIAEQLNVEDLTKKLKKLIDDEKYRKTLQENLFKRVNENYTWKKTVEKVKEAIENAKD